jgi:hypothetical protein
MGNPNISTQAIDGAGGVRDDGAQMYTGIDERTLAKQTSENSSAAASHITTPGRTRDSPRDSGDANGRYKRSLVHTQSNRTSCRRDTSCIACLDPPYKPVYFMEKFEVNMYIDGCRLEVTQTR